MSLNITYEELSRIVQVFLNTFFQKVETEINEAALTVKNEIDKEYLQAYIVFIKTFVQQDRSHMKIILNDLNINVSESESELNLIQMKRKELVDLCEKHKLPVRRKNSDMINELTTHFKNL